jgi:beta-glucosidase
MKWSICVCCALLASLVLCLRPQSSSAKFPSDFLWGTATAAYQVEGGIKNDWSSAGIDAKEAVGHYDRYAQDMDEARKIGTNAYRFSLEWARIEPQRGKFDQVVLKHYQNMVHTAQKKGLKPVVTLWHFTHPQWFSERGGWLHPQAESDFIRYVERVVFALGANVDLWVVLNEPTIYTLMAYGKGLWPPFHKDPVQGWRILHCLLRVQRSAYQAIHKYDVQAQVGIAHHWLTLKPAQWWNPLNHLQTQLVTWLLNDYPLRFWARLPSYDWVGLNYYAQYVLSLKGALLGPDHQPASFVNRDSHGLSKALFALHHSVGGLPIYVTENGTAVPQAHQTGDFLQSQIEDLREVLAQGIPLKGYFYWSLMDNFEWTEGFSPQFGLLTTQRQWKPSAKVYQRLIHQNMGK